MWPVRSLLQISSCCFHRLKSRKYHRWTTWIQCQQQHWKCGQCPKKTLLEKFRALKMFILGNRTSELLSIRHLPPVNHLIWHHWISNCESDHILIWPKICNFLSDVSTKIHKSSWLTSELKILEAFYTSCWKILAILRAIIFFNVTFFVRTHCIVFLAVLTEFVL